MNNPRYIGAAWIRLVTIIVALFVVRPAARAQSVNKLELKRAGYTVSIDTSNVQLWLQYGDTEIKPHPLGNLAFAHVSDTASQPVASMHVVHHGDDSLMAIVKNAQGLRALVNIRLENSFFSITLTPEQTAAAKDDLYKIDFRTAALGPAYGLGDHGGYGDNTDVTGFVDDDFGNRDNWHRFISTFTIFPAHQFAQVLFSEKTKRVAVTREENKLGVAGEKQAKVYYFLGDPPQIYQAYKRVRAIEGYPDLKPKYRFFQLGYEAFGALGWNTYQSSVEADINRYLQLGYPISWAVVGSGFWKGERRNPNEGATTSFGIWDDTASGVRNDNLPNPRYPNPQAFKEFFRAKDISLLLGLRINFKAPEQYGGHLLEEHDGSFTQHGLKRGYFVTDKTGKLETYRVNFPQGNVFLLDGKNSDAVNWYVAGVDRWGVAGFKEDLMLYDGKKLNNDAKLNAVNQALMNKNYYIMARNSAYSVAGDILRLEDTQHGSDQDRPLINGLNYAASGVSAVYLDIVAGKYLKNPLTEDQKLYFVRNAMVAAVSPVMAMGHGPWHLQNQHYEMAVKKAVDWHTEHAAYLYSEAVKSYETGFPYTMTPLPVAFPDDSSTYRMAGKEYRQYSWMLGESLLATPLYGNDYASVRKRNVYLPKGRWMDYESKAWFEGPVTLENYDFPFDKIPLFVGGKGVLVKQRANHFEARIYPTMNEEFHYVFHFPDGAEKSVIHKAFAGWRKGEYRIRSEQTGKEQLVSLDDLNPLLTFLIEPGNNYKLTLIAK